ncbi:MAG: methyl-accepting chemotaxis protein [Aquaspirillum sp.]|nr:methyl-accepting chemotaxis protein [Aquaspirillum sp.]
MLSRFGIATKLNVLLFAMIVGVIAIAALTLNAKRVAMFEERKIQIRTAVELAVGVAQYFEEKAQQGEMTRAQAQELAKRAIGHLRYSGKEYFSIYDMHPRMVWYHDPKLIGKDLSALKDPNGKYLVVEMRDAVQKQGAGFVEYLWPQPGKTEPIPKVAYAAGFAPWGWIVASGLYFEDLNAQFIADAQILLAQIIGVALVMGLLTLWIKNQIVRPIKTLESVMHTAERERDLTVEAQLAHQDELGNMAKAFNSLIRHIREAVSAVNQNSHEVNQRAGEVAKQSTTIHEITVQQGQAVQSSSAALEEISVSIQHLASQIEHLRAVATDSRAGADAGVGALSTLQQDIDLAHSSLSGELSRATSQLGQDMAAITRMTSEVRDIADQTNLLALNAAIEAARAGEMGRGFAVVADEVRKLAEKSAISAGQIDDITRRLVDQSYAMQNHVQEGSEHLSSGRQHIEAVGSILRNTHQAAHTTEQQIAEMASALNEQHMAVQQLAQKAESLSASVLSHQNLIDHGVQTAEGLRELSEGLLQTAARFRVA